MKLAFSNIAWSPHDDAAILEMLKQRGIGGIEVAPTKVWPSWKGATPDAAREYARRMRDLGFEIPALQAVLFDCPQARFFTEEGESALVTHLTNVADIAAALGTAVVVLGAPRQRDRGTMTLEQATDRAVRVLYELAQIFAARGTSLCIEPNPRAYHCNFICNAREASELVDRVNHPGFGLHLDAGGMFLERDTLPECWPRVRRQLRHFHISEPHLADFRTPQVPHRENLDFLAASGYAGWYSVEMREPSVPLSLAGPWSFIPQSSRT